MTSHWRERLLASTRGRVLALLRASEATVNELAASLSLTDNAVRAHLAALEGERLVEQRGVRRGAGKPSHVFGITAEGEALFPKAYATVLSALIAALEQDLDGARLDALLRAVGSALAQGREPGPGSGFEARVGLAEELMAELSGGAAVERGPGRRVAVVRGAGCPLSAVVREHPEVCSLVESLVEAVSGLPAEVRCERDGHPRCAFRLGGGRGQAGDGRGGR